MAHHDLQLVEAVVRMGKAHHLHLGELVQTDQAARVLAGGTGFGTEAGRGGTVGAGQVGLVQHLTGVDVGQGHLGGGDEVVVPGGHLEEVFLELGQLARAGHGGAVDHEGRTDFDVVLVLHMLVQEEVDQGAVQTGGPAHVQGKAAAGQTGGALEIQGGAAQLPVLTDLEIELARRAPAEHFHVLGLVLAHGHAGVRDVGHPHEPVFHSGLGFGGLHVQGLDAGRQGAQFFHHVGGVPTLTLDLGHLAGGGVLLLFQAFHFGQQRTTAAVQFEELIYFQRRLPVGQGLGQHFGLFLHQFEVDHKNSCIACAMWRPRYHEPPDLARQGHCVYKKSQNFLKHLSCETLP